jgi:hypothetical protein
MPRRPALYPRPRWQWATDLPHAESAWTSLIDLPDVRFLSDNQLSLWAAADGPGAEKVSFYPVPRAPHLDTDHYDVPRIMAESLHTVNGPSARIYRGGEVVEFDSHDSSWLPSRIERRFVAADVTISETITTHDDMVIFWIKPEGKIEDLSIEWSSSVDRTANASWRAHGTSHVCLHDDGVANGWVWLGSEPTSWRTDAGPGCLSFTAPVPEEGVLLVLMMGYDQAAVERRLESMISQLTRSSTAQMAEELLGTAHDLWDWYFTRMVPRFDGGPEWVGRLYHYMMASHKINMYDIPYEPFVRPYTCPWKTSAVWQWSWNTPMNAIAERWLNDMSWAEAGIELIHQNGGALNVGASLHRLRKPRHFRDVNEYMPAVSDASKGEMSLPATARQFDWAFIMPYTTPLAVHGTWEVFRRTGDERWLKEHLSDLIDYERMLSGHDPDGDGLVDFVGMVDEYDYSLRWKDVIPGFTKGNESLTRFDRPLELIDINAQLCLLREDIARAADMFGDEKLAKRMRKRREKTALAINELMWNEDRGCYQDIDSETHEQTGVLSVAAYSVLLAGVAPDDRAQRMLALLDDPNVFGSPFPVPSVSMDTEGIDPGHITYGGDVLVTSGVWTTVQGLVRYGMVDKAREIIWKTLEMLGQPGPSSAYSYHSVTGEPNMDRHTFCSQSAIMVDLFVQYVIGLIPREDDIIEVWPFALPTEWDHVEFGPFVWRGDVNLTIVWDRAEGYTIKAGESVFTVKEPRHLWLGLDMDDSLIELANPAVYGEPVMA